MIEPKTERFDRQAASWVDDDLPNHVGSEKELLAALAVGDSDIADGRTVSFEDVAAEFRRTPALD